MLAVDQGEKAEALDPNWKQWTSRIDGVEQMAWGGTSWWDHRWIEFVANGLEVDLAPLFDRPGCRGSNEIVLDGLVCSF